MTRNAPLVVALCLAVSPAAEAAGSDVPMNVFVTAAEVEARKEVDDATKKALKEKHKEAKEARKALEKQLKKQHGKKREAWPPEKDEELYLAEEAEALAEADYEYRKIDPEGIADSVKDVMESIQGKGIAGRKERVVLVGSADEADLLVKVAARRASKDSPMAIAPSNCYLLFDVAPGGKVKAENFAKVPANYRPRRFGMAVWKIASPKPDRMAFRFESYNGGGTPYGCQGAAANAAAGTIDKFIEDNYVLLTAN